MRRKAHKCSAGCFYDPHSTIRISNAEHIVHKTGTRWDEGNIGKRTSVLHRQLRDAQALKTTRPTIRLESQGCLVVSESFFMAIKKGRIK